VPNGKKNEERLRPCEMVSCCPRTKTQKLRRCSRKQSHVKRKPTNVYYKRHAVPCSRWGCCTVWWIGPA